MKASNNISEDGKTLFGEVDLPPMSPRMRMDRLMRRAHAVKVSARSISRLLAIAEDGKSEARDVIAANDGISDLRDFVWPRDLRELCSGLEEAMAEQIRWENKGEGK